MIKYGKSKLKAKHPLSQLIKFDLKLLIIFKILVNHRLMNIYFWSWSVYLSLKFSSVSHWGLDSNIISLVSTQLTSLIGHLILVSFSCDDYALP